MKDFVKFFSVFTRTVYSIGLRRPLDKETYITILRILRLKKGSEILKIRFIGCCLLKAVMNDFIIPRLELIIFVGLPF